MSPPPPLPSPPWCGIDSPSTPLVSLPPLPAPPRCGIDSILLPTTKKFAINVMENSWVHKFKDWGDKVRGERRRASGGKWSGGEGSLGVLVGATVHPCCSLSIAISAVPSPPTRASCPPGLAPHQIPKCWANVPLLLDYRCYVEGGKIGNKLPDDVKRCEGAGEEGVGHGGRTRGSITPCRTTSRGAATQAEGC